MRGLRWVPVRGIMRWAAILFLGIGGTPVADALGHPLGAQAHPEGSVDSPMFRGTANHGGWVEAGGVERLGGVAWVFETHGPIRSTPALVDGVLYVGSSDGHLYALSADNGRELWRFDAGSAVGSSPAVVDGLVVFGDRNNTWRALERTGGRLVWELPTGPDLPLAWGWEGWDYLAASAVATSVPGATPGTDRSVVVFGSGDGLVRSVDARSGRVLWSHATTRRIRSTPAVADGTVYVGGGDGVIYALDVSTGEPRWTFETAGMSMDAAQSGFDRTQIQASPAVVDGVVFVGSRDASLVCSRCRGWIAPLARARRERVGRQLTRRPGRMGGEWSVIIYEPLGAGCSHGRCAVARRHRRGTVLVAGARWTYGVHRHRCRSNARLRSANG